MKHSIIFLSLSLAASLWACQKENMVADRFLEAVPREYMVRLDVPDAQKNLKDLGDVAESYLTTVRVTRDVNTAVRNWLLWVEAIVRYPASDFDDTSSTWGPWEPDDGLSSVLYRFRMWINEDESFDYAFELRPKNDAGAPFVPVYTGHVDPGGLPTLNAGTMHFDFDAAASVDLAVDSAGTITVAYDYIGGQKDITVAFVDWQEHASSTPVTANYHYVASAAGDGHFDFETWADVHAGTEEATQYPGLEHWRLRSRWTPDGEGRSDVLVTGEDLTAQGVTDFRQSECWDTSFASGYLWRQVTIPPDPVYTEVLWGAESACAAFPAFSEPEL